MRDWAMEPSQRVVAICSMEVWPLGTCNVPSSMWGCRTDIAPSLKK